MYRNKKVVFSENTLDMSTGELTQKKWITRKVENKDEFVTLYIEHISLLNKLSLTEMKLLLACVAYIEWNTNELVFNPKIMEGITSSLSISIGAVRNTISKLAKKGLFKKKKSNWYILNPNIFFKGNEIARAKVFELTYQWNTKS